MFSNGESKKERASIAGTEEVSQPYPVFLKGIVSKGFGRGSKDLGIPTANLPEAVATYAGQYLETGIYFGWASVGTDAAVYPMVMSFGWNPFYKNEKRSAEVHIIHEFATDFYDEELRVAVAGYIRPEFNYVDVASLIDDIKTDIRVAQQSLSRVSYMKLKLNEFFV